MATGSYLFDRQRTAKNIWIFTRIYQYLFLYPSSCQKYLFFYYEREWTIKWFGYWLRFQYFTDFYSSTYHLNPSLFFLASNIILEVLGSDISEARQRPCQVRENLDIKVETQSSEDVKIRAEGILEHWISLEMRTMAATLSPYLGHSSLAISYLFWLPFPSLIGTERVGNAGFYYISI